MAKEISLLLCLKLRYLDLIIRGVNKIKSKMNKKATKINCLMKILERDLQIRELVLRE